MSSAALTAEQARPEEREAYLAGQMWAVRWQLYLGFVGLALGGLMGILQALERLGGRWDLYEEAQLNSYYQGLTIHGVTLALVFTFTFSNAFLTLTTIRGFGRPMASTWLTQGSLYTAAAGVVLGSYAMLADKATVLFTFYPPLEATPVFYLAAVFLVVSTWLVLANMVLTYLGWRRDHPGERIPLLSYMSLMTYIMWGIASSGIAVEVVVFLLPWSLGWVDGTDVTLNRTLFWLTGHPIVYFWLLPAYVSWYYMIPHQVGGRLYSDGLTRLTFILFLLFSTPVGLHHQFSDPGISQTMKGIHGVLTFIVIFPSMMTAFSIMAALEMGGRRAGGKGLFGWVLRLPWGNPSVTAQLLAMLVFTLGGITGSINASYTINKVVHNTAFIPGHFHMTVGTAVALSVMGIAYWLIPHLTGRALFMPRLALAQAWLWAIGILIFARGQISGGLESMPRRTAIGLATYELPGWDLANALTAIGGSVMGISGLLFFIVLLGTLFNTQRAVVEMPASQPLHGPRESWQVLDRLGLWTAVAIALVLIAYVPVFVKFGSIDLNAPGLQVW
jgi:cytochrome c oxidase subunit 1